MGCFAILLTILAGNRQRLWNLPVVVLRLVPAGALLCVSALVGLTIQACSSSDGKQAPSFRDLSVEITTLTDGAEFYLSDAQQSPLAVTTKTASVQSRTALHPFGHVRFQTGKQGDPWGFVGNEEDRGSGISDFHARPYRPELGVFLAVDPVALLSPEQTIGSPTRMLAYAYAGGDPITQADGNGLTFGQFVHGMWDQGVENVKAAAQATVASVRSNVALAMTGDIGGAASNIAIGAAHGMIQTVKDVGNFGNDFAKAAFASNDYEAGRLAVKPVMTAMTTTAAVMGTRLGVEKVQARGKFGSAGTRGPNLAGLSSGADNVATLPKLNKSLASQQQLGEIGSGGGKVMAGKGGGVIIRDEPRLVAQHGGELGDWQKVSSSNYKASDGTSFETHGYRSAVTGEVVEPKTKFTGP